MELGICFSDRNGDAVMVNKGVIPRTADHCEGSSCLHWTGIASSGTSQNLLKPGSTASLDSCFGMFRAL
uniref:Uncharacterized protein n=1 Tax=Trichobilharzia regenti TaxID=157069 RepID=A0AA85IPC4_TRIRE|nr:unnamed protein product [Trichobilharzia regenti]